jgi:NAD+ synthase (glutamine-hydrolysing)
MSSLRIALAQIDTTVGDLAGNAAAITQRLRLAREGGAALVVFPELTLTGYPPEDLLLKPGFAGASRAALERLLPESRGLTAVVGFAERDHDLFNSAAVLHDGRIAGVYRKRFLPNYAVFDEERYFARGATPVLFALEPAPGAGGECIRFGVSICEDIWYPNGPPEAQAAAGAELLINIAASPFQSGKARSRERMLATRAADNVAIVAFCNHVGGQDELVFDGGSAIFDERGELLARARSFEEDLVVADVDVAGVFRQRLRDPRRRNAATLLEQPVRWIALGAPAEAPPTDGAIESPVAAPLGDEEEVYRALVLGTRDYVRKNGFEDVVLGLSGGVDSALVAAVAVDALGSRHVVGVSLPSRHSSEHSRSDAAELARRLGIRLETIEIEPVCEAYGAMLAPLFGGRVEDVTEENLQSRARGNLLMALSNKFGWLVLTTGNKSEMAVGYTTIYGDMAGGFAVIKDVPKTWVGRLCRWRNAAVGPQIPDAILTKPPSAELRPGQRDSDTLPPYDVLDAILAAYVEEDCSADQIVRRGQDPTTVRRVIAMVDGSEYKRRQAPPGPKVTSKAFGKDRRLPITNRFGSTASGHGIAQATTSAAGPSRPPRR